MLPQWMQTDLRAMYTEDHPSFIADRTNRQKLMTAYVVERYSHLINPIPDMDLLNLDWEMNLRPPAEWFWGESDDEELDDCPQTTKTRVSHSCACCGKPLKRKVLEPIAEKPEDEKPSSTPPAENVRARI